MSSTNALRITETRGLIGAAEAADTMVKAISVTLIGREQADGGLVVVVVRGDVGTVKTATNVGATAAERAGKLLSTHAILCPYTEVDAILSHTTTKL